MKQARRLCATWARTSWRGSSICCTTGLSRGCGSRRTWQSLQGQLKNGVEVLVSVSSMVELGKWTYWSIDWEADGLKLVWCMQELAKFYELSYCIHVSKEAAYTKPLQMSQWVQPYELDPYVSRRHALISPHGQKYPASELQSKSFPWDLSEERQTLVRFKKEALKLRHHNGSMQMAHIWSKKEPSLYIFVYEWHLDSSDTILNQSFWISFHPAILKFRATV